MILRPPKVTRSDSVFPNTTLFRAGGQVDMLALEIIIGERCPAVAAEAARRLVGAVEPRRRAARPADRIARHADRSEEHTSELQSLMRNSYAVFCLKKTSIQYT